MQSNTSKIIVFEILRDCWQIVSLIFDSFANDVSQLFSQVFGEYWSYLWSFCFSCWTDDEKTQRDISQYTFLAEALIALISTLIFTIRAYNDIKYDSESQTTIMQRNTRRLRKYIFVLVLIITTLYLPLVRDCMKVLTCDTSFVAISNSCYSVDNGHIYYCVLAVLCILFYLIPAPWFLLKLINNHKPKPIFFDASGNEKQQGFTKNDYAKELENQKYNPYKTLYDGYERDWVSIHFTVT